MICWRSRHWRRRLQMRKKTMGCSSTISASLPQRELVVNRSQLLTKPYQAQPYNIEHWGVYILGCPRLIHAVWTMWDMSHQQQSETLTAYRHLPACSTVTAPTTQSTPSAFYLELRHVQSNVVKCGTTHEPEQECAKPQHNILFIRFAGP